jgi:hypothetical protein
MMDPSGQRRQKLDQDQPHLQSSPTAPIQKTVTVLSPSKDDELEKLRKDLEDRERLIR